MLRAARRLGLVVLVTTMLAGPAHAAGFQAGAAREITTPPAAGTPAATAADQQFAGGWATCPSATFPDRGSWGLQEPFTDTNANGAWDDNPPEPYCDANGNGHWDGIYSSGKFGLAQGVHDDIDVRAVAISDGSNKPVVYASVVQQGLFDYYTDAMRQRLHDVYHVDADLVVSANHNESSPDSVGIYGALQTPAGVSARSGIDEYYMAFLEDKVAHAAADAVHAMKPAGLFASQPNRALAPAELTNPHVPILSGLSLRLSRQFPTTVALSGDNRDAAIDTKLGVLQARGADGKPIFTVMSFAAHNQEMGNAGPALSADWPGAFEAAFDAAHPGMSMFLVGDNGSQEDPQSEPTAVPNGSENHTSVAVQYQQAQATGAQFAAVTADAAAHAVELPAGPVRLRRTELCVPLENNGFAALFAAGVFGKRQAYVCDPSTGAPLSTSPSGKDFRTFVSVGEIGPDLELVANPGESFPALMLGSPFGKSEESCDRPNPEVPTWHARAPFRFQVGLADDLIGYLIPPWGFASGVPGLFSTDSCYDDMNGHGHKLESESVGPTAAGVLANSLASSLDQLPDPAGRIGNGRYVLADGTLSRWPTGAVGILVGSRATTSLDAGTGTLVGKPGVNAVGGRAVDATGEFMDYDGQPQDGPSVITRGMEVFSRAGCATARYYVSVFDELSGQGPGGPVKTGPAGAVNQSCGHDDGTQDDVFAGGGGAGGGGQGGNGSCVDRSPPRVRIRRARLAGGQLRLRGRSSDRGCSGAKGRPLRVVVSIRRRSGRMCRFVGARGRLGHRRRCSRPLLLLARGTASWRLSLRLHLRAGRYRLAVRAVDRGGNLSPARRGSSVRTLVLRP
jgi:hypothetical protein